MNASQRAEARAIAEQAQAWFIMNREHELSAEQQHEFLTWLQGSPAHVREYLAFAKLAVDLRAVMQGVDAPLAELIEAARNDTGGNVVPFADQMLAQDPLNDEEFRPQACIRGTNRMPLLAAIVAVIAVSLFGWWLIPHMPLHKDYSTAHGEQRIVSLADGSVMHINSDSDVRVVFTEAERDIVVKRGQALFKVTKDKARPFRVQVGNTQVVAVGTEFDVRRVGDGVLVTVVEGAVAVTELAMIQSGKAGTVKNPAPLQLAAGQQARLGDGAMPARSRAKAVHVVDVRPAVAWVEQKIMFEQETLQNVAAEFNRYGSTQLIIEDTQIATLRLSGVFHAYDLESFVLYLESLRGLQVRRGTDRILISLARASDGTAM